MASMRGFFRDRGGASAIEFAIVAPLFILVLTGIVAYGIYFSAALTIEQIAADAARYSVAGLTPAERADLARHYVSTATLGDPLIDRSRISLSVGQDPAAPQQFTVRLSYDARNLPIWNIFTLPLPSTEIERFATIRIGGA